MDRDTIAEATSAVSSEDEFEAAVSLVRKKLRSMASVQDPVVRRRRLMAALARRGYGYETIQRAVTVVEGEDGGFESW